MTKNYEGKRARLGLIAEETGYSLSPLLHRFSAETLGFQSSYEGYNLKPQSLKGFLEEFQKKGGLGLNVSNPLKKEVLSLVEAPGLDSVNTLKFTEKAIYGYSTDGQGFWNSLIRSFGSLHKISAFCFMGSGDVYPSLLVSLREKLLGRPIYFLRRSQRNDKLLKELYPESYFLHFSPTALQGVLKNFPSEEVCLVQGTSAPTKGENLSEFLPVLEGYKGFFCDLVYSTPSRLYRVLKARGVPAIDGLPMLIEQALLSQKIWWGRSASYEEVQSFLSSHLKGAS